MRFAEIFRFELEVRLRSPSTWIYGALLLLLPFLMLHMIDGSSARMNSPGMIATLSSIVGMVGMLVTAALFGDAATRDVQTRMHPLVYSAPLSRAEYLGGRFLAALALNALLLLAVPLGQVLGASMPYQDPRVFGPFRLVTYAQPYLFILLPNLLFSGAILFALAALTRQMLPAFLGGIGLFIGYLFSGDARDALASSTLRALADPFAVSLVEERMDYWTPAQQNTQLIGLPTELLINRLFWMAIGLALLAILYHRFRFAHAIAERPRRGARRAVLASVEAERSAPISVPVAPREFGARARVGQTLAVARRSLEEIAGNRAFWIILPGAVLFTLVMGWDVGDNVFGTSTWSVTHLIAVTVLGQALAPVVTLLIAFFAGELVWRERDVRVSAISDAAPLPDWVALLGRFLALVAMIVALHAVLMASGILVQALQGWHRYEPGLYLRILFGLKLADYVLVAALAMAVHVIVNHKYVGHLVIILVFLFTLFAEQLGIRHHLLVYGATPGWTYSDMSGFGPFIGPFTWFVLYWAAWALLLAVAARLFWVRGRDRESRPALAFARARLTGGLARAAGVALALIVALGGFIFYNTNVLNDFRTPFQEAALRAEYERRYKRFEDAAQPTLTRAELRIDLHPERRAAELRGTYTLVNRTGRAMDSLHVVLHPNVRERSVSFDRGARRVLRDARLRYAVYTLDRPLAPGDSVRLVFDLALGTRGFTNDRLPTDVVANGTFLDRRWLPGIGYQRSQELSGADERRDHGLPPAPRVPGPDEPRGRAARLDPDYGDLVQVDAVIGTAGDQVAVTSGTLVREWRRGGRRYFHYRTEGPTAFMAPVLSARYAVRRGQWGNVPLRVLYHPGHEVNVDRLMRGMQSSLDYFSRSFGPYQFPELRIVEFPRYASFARAYPNTIAFSEGSAFLTRIREGDVDRPFFVTAHETAHQWWGHQLEGAPVRGQALLSETLAQYSAMMVMETALGPEQVRRFYDYEMDRYLRGRRLFSSREVPLLDVEDQASLYYHKGAVVMYTLREHLGEAAVNGVLRRFLQKHRAGVPPHPTSRDLYADFVAVAPDSLRPLLHDLFEQITLWNVRTDSARVERTAAGAYRVALDVTASKVRADSIGNETPVPMNDLVEVAVYAQGADGATGGAPMYLRRHRLRAGRQTITVEVPRPPARAGVDPRGKLIQLERADNVVDVQPARGR